MITGMLFMIIQILMLVTRYAGTVMEVCKVNEELNRQLEEVLVIPIPHPHQYQIQKNFNHNHQITAFAAR